MDDNKSLALVVRAMPDGALLVLNVRFRPKDGERANPRVYSHAALRAGGYWYLTGSALQGAGWGAIESWFRRNNRELVSVELATGARTIWPVTAEADSDDDDGAAGVLVRV